MLMTNTVIFCLHGRFARRQQTPFSVWFSHCMTRVISITKRSIRAYLYLGNAEYLRASEVIMLSSCRRDTASLGL